MTGWTLSILLYFIITTVPRGKNFYSCFIKEPNVTQRLKNSLKFTADSFPLPKICTSISSFWIDLLPVLTSWESFHAPYAFIPGSYVPWCFPATLCTLLQSIKHGLVACLHPVLFPFHFLLRVLSLSPSPAWAYSQRQFPHKGKEEILFTQSKHNAVFLRLFLIPVSCLPVIIW